METQNNQMENVEQPEIVVFADGIIAKRIDDNHFEYVGDMRDDAKNYLSAMPMGMSFISYRYRANGEVYLKATNHQKTDLMMNFHRRLLDVQTDLLNMELMGVLDKANSKIIYGYYNKLFNKAGKSIDTLIEHNFD